MKITELIRVRSQNARARSMKTCGTLTLSEWEVTLTDFKGMCAYCQFRPFTALEHFIPFGQSGDGTHVNNCLPTCQFCNNLKKNHPLKEVIRCFGDERVRQLQSYLASRTYIIDGTNREHAPKPQPKPKIKAAQKEKPALIPIPIDVPYVTIEQAALGLGTSRATIYKEIDLYSIQRYKIGKHVHIKREDFEYIHSAREAPWKVFPIKKRSS